MNENRREPAAAQPTQEPGRKGADLADSDVFSRASEHNYLLQHTNSYQKPAEDGTRAALRFCSMDSPTPTGKRAERAQSGAIALYYALRQAEPGSARRGEGRKRDI